LQQFFYTLLEKEGNMRQTLPALGAIGLSLAFGFVGCAATPQPPSQLQSVAPSITAKALAETPRGQPAAGSSSASSLEAHVQGKAPMSGPLKEIYFEFDSYDLNPDARATLKVDTEWLKGNPSSRVEIEGHCDERGTGEYNLALGAKRAQAAKEYLQSLGIAPQRLSTISYGKELPGCRERTEECYQKNRRDRFVILGERPTS
jgi:peptidoglycan-associated lipoprotein